MLYPGLPSHPQHDVAARQFRPGVAGGMLAFEVAGGRAAGRAVIDALRLPELTASLGSVHTMVVHPPSTSHRQSTEAELLAAGITPGPAAGVGRARGPRGPPGRLRRTRSRPPARGRPGARRRLGGSSHREPARSPRPASARPSGRNVPARLGYGLWRLFTSVDFAVAQIIFLALHGRRRDDDQAAPRLRVPLGDRLRGRDRRPPRPLRPAARARRSSTSSSGCGCSRSSARRGSAPRWSCWSSRSWSARSTGRRGCGAACATSGSPSPSRSSTRSLPDRAAMDGVAGRRRPRRPPARTASTSARRPTADGTRYLYGDRHQYTKLATLLTHLGLILFLVAAAATSRLGDEQGLVVAEGESLTVQPIGTPGLLLVKNLDFEAPGFETGQADRLHDRPGGLPGRPARSRARRSGSTTRCRSPATRSTRTASGRRRTSSLRDAAGAAAVGRARCR